MAHTNDEFNPLSEEELRQREEDALFRRRVRDEVRRIQSGEAQEDIERDIEEEEILEAEQTRKEANLLLPAYSQITKIEIVREGFAHTPKQSIKRFLYN